MRLITAVLLITATATSLAGQTLRGTVRQDSSGLPLANVEVVLEGTTFRAVTDASGRYLLSGASAGNRVALFRLVGYRPVRLSVKLVADDTVQGDVALIREAVQQLDPIEVAGKTPGPRGIGREAFEERRRMGFGFFIDSSDLRRSENRRVSDMLRGISGLNLVAFRDCPPNRSCPTEYRAASGRGETSMFRGGGRDDYCWMTVILDGNVLYNSGGLMPPPDFSRDFRPADLHAIEVYRSSAQVPPEFGGTVGQCGAILLWSRRGP